jgi:outer membrane protein OmpA-like peptidoglycan-associated protein
MNPRAMKIGCFEEARRAAAFGLAVLLMSAPVFAAFNDDGWGARGAAMGGAYTAVADDSDGFLWNPAAPARLELSQYSFMHSMPFTGMESVQIAKNSFSYAHPFLNQASGALGLGWTNLTASSIYREDAAVLSYSRGLYPFTVSDEGSRPYLYGGLNVKYLRSSFTLDQRSAQDPVFAGGSSKEAASADLGLLGFFDRFSFGAAAQDVTRPNVGLQATDRVPTTWRIGTAYRQNILFFDDATLSAEYSIRASDKRFHIGWENWFFDRRAAFRAGWNNHAMSFGFGYRMTMPGSWDLNFDYTYQVPFDLQSQGTGSHLFSVSTRFGGPGEKETAVFSTSSGYVEEEAGTAAPAKGGATQSAAGGTAPGIVGQAQGEIETMEGMIRDRRLNPIRFITDSSRVVTDSLVTLDRVVRILRKYPNLRMRIIGGPVEESPNDKRHLSAQRARTVAGYFVARGISGNRVIPEEGKAGTEQASPVSFVFCE